MHEYRTLDEELSIEELAELQEKMCGTLKPRRLTQEELEQLIKRSGDEIYAYDNSKRNRR